MIMVLNYLVPKDGKLRWWTEIELNFLRKPLNEDFLLLYVALKASSRREVILLSRYMMDSTYTRGQEEKLWSNNFWWLQNLSKTNRFCNFYLIFFNTILYPGYYYQNFKILIFFAVPVLKRNNVLGTRLFLILIFLCLIIRVGQWNNPRTS